MMALMLLMSRMPRSAVSGWPGLDTLLGAVTTRTTRTRTAARGHCGCWLRVRLIGSDRRGSSHLLCRCARLRVGVTLRSRLSACALAVGRSVWATGCGPTMSVVTATAAHITYIALNRSIGAAR
jgi:hypothetical protein